MARKKEYDRDEVLEKAMKVFWDNGYANTAMRDLQIAMGINQFSIYSEFESKHGLFIEVLKRYKLLNKEVILKKLMNSNGSIADIERFFRDFVKAVKSGQSANGCLFANTAMEIGNTDPDVKQQLRGFFDLLKTTFIRLLEKSKSRREIDANSDITKLANYLVGVTEGMALTAKVLNEEDLNDFIEVTIKTLKG